MNDNDRADQPDPGRRFRRPRRWRTWGRRGGELRTIRGRGPVVGAGWFDPRTTDFMGDTAWLFGQPVPVTSLGNAVMDVSGCMLSAWPSAPTCRGKASRPLHPTAPPRASRRRLPSSSGAGRGRAHAARPGRTTGHHTHTLSGASNTPGGDPADGDGPAGALGVDHPDVGCAEPLQGSSNIPPA